LVALTITALVYGAVAVIVKLDDIGLHLARRGSTTARATGRVLLAAMPVTLAVLSKVGTLAMLWVGGQILLHGLDELGWAVPAQLAHEAQGAVEHATGPLGGVLGWVTYAFASAIVGMIVGAVLAGLVHQIKARRGKSAH
jgi:predicted DNA repair protein MutK